MRWRSTQKHAIPTRTSLLSAEEKTVDEDREPGNGVAEETETPEAICCVTTSDHWRLENAPSSRRRDIKGLREEK